MQTIKQGAAIGGWVCFGLGVVFMFIPIPTWFIYVPLFVASFVLSIVAMSQGRIASGVTLLLANIIGAPILFFIAFAVGLATWTAVSTGATERTRQRAANRSSSIVTNQDGRVSDTQSVSEAKVARALPAFEKIEGAFGKKLGEQFDPAAAIGGSKLTDGTPMYEFSTTTGFRSFTRYYALITPTTHKIYSIWGIGNVENSQAGQKEQAVVMELLKEKYGAEKTGLFDTLGDTKRVSQGDRYVLTKTSGFGEVTLEIRYYDGELAKLAEKERLSSEVQKADKTGL